MQSSTEPLVQSRSLRERVNRGLSRLPTWPVYVLGAVPVAGIYWRGIAGELGVDPVKVIEHSLGLWALWALLAGLAITPLRRHAGLNLMRFRRAAGLLAFGYVVVHLLTWALLDVQRLDAAGRDILKRPYITIGMLAFAMLVPLAATSANAAIRWLGGRRWRQLHRLVYPAVLLGTLHYVMLVKGWQPAPLAYLALAAGLLALRALPGR